MGGKELKKMYNAQDEKETDTKAIILAWFVVIVTGVMALFLFGGCSKQEDKKVVISFDEVMPETENDSTIYETEIDKESVDDKKEYADLNEEINAIEIKYNEIGDSLSENATQYDMNANSAECLKLWDDELNSLWSRFSEAADEKYKQSVLEEQRSWIQDKEAEVKAAGASVEGGSIQPLIENTTAMEITRVRCYELAGYLAKATGTSFDLEVPECSNGSMTYYDKQGTEEIYSELILTPGMEGYDVRISLYRLTTLTGYAFEQNDDVFSYIDNENGVEGIIRINEDNATFEVTKSDVDLLNVGEKFVFSDKD